MQVSVPQASFLPNCDVTSRSVPDFVCFVEADGRPPLRPKFGTHPWPVTNLVTILRRFLAKLDNVIPTVLSSAIFLAAESAEYAEIFLVKISAYSAVIFGLWIGYWYKNSRSSIEGEPLNYGHA